MDNHSPSLATRPVPQSALLAALRALLFRMDELSSAFLSLMAVGVTSMSSSACTYPIASSRLINLGGVSRTCSSAPDARMFVSFFSLHGLTSIVYSRECSPMIIPSYTSVLGPTNRVPRASS